MNGNSGKVTIYSVHQTRIKEAVGWMMTLYPLMSQRRKAKIREVILAWKNSIGDQRGKHWGRLKRKSDENSRQYTISRTRDTQL